MEEKLLERKLDKAEICVFNLDLKWSGMKWPGLHSDENLFSKLKVLEKIRLKK